MVLYINNSIPTKHQHWEKVMYMRASGASELRKFWHFCILKLLKLSCNTLLVHQILCRYKWHACRLTCTDKTPKRHYRGGGGGAIAPRPPLATLMIYVVKTFHLLRSEFHSTLTPVEWTFTTQRVEYRPVHSMFITLKEVITDVITQGVTSVTNRVKCTLFLWE